MNLCLHLVSLPLQLLLHHLQFLLSKLLLRPPIFQSGSSVPSPNLLSLQFLPRPSQLSRFRFQVGVLLTEFANVVIPRFEFSVQFIESTLKIPAEPVGVLLPLEPHELQLVVLLLLALQDRLLLKTGLLQVLILEDALLVTQAVGLTGKLPILLLQ